MKHVIDTLFLKQLLESRCESISGTPISQKVVLAVLGILEVFTGPVVESALDVFEKWKVP